MKVDPKKLNILFVDDGEVRLAEALKKQGFNVAKESDIENLDTVCDGRYQMIFFDINDIGKIFDSVDKKGTGLDLLKYVAEHNPLIHTIVYSSKPWDGKHVNEAHLHADCTLVKDPSLGDAIKIIEEFAGSIDRDWMVKGFTDTVKVGSFNRWWLRNGAGLSKEKLEKLTKKSGMAADSLKIAANITSLIVGLLALAGV
jgi:hypothetical protein